MAKRDRLSDEALLAAISAAEETALGSVQGAVSSDRSDAINRYYGKPYGDEQPGRSSVVSRDVADVVEGVVANVVKPFVGGDQVVQFDPRSEEDEKAAEQETDYVNFVALERNNGFVWLVSAIKDALLLRAGYVKCQWEVRSDEMVETYYGQSEEEYQLLLKDGEVEEVAHSEYPDPMFAAALEQQMLAQPAMAMMMGQQPGAQQLPEVPNLHDVKVRRTAPKAYVRIDPVPPGEVLVSEHARTPSLQDVDFVQHRPVKSISELRQAGYIVPDDIVDDEQGDTVEELARERFGAAGTDDDSTGVAERRRVMFKETYIRIDRDGDGVAELRKICSVGQTILKYKGPDDKEIEADEECEVVGLASFSGVLVPHQHLGMSIYDLVEDLARIKTALMRSYLDNRYLQNNGRYAVNADLVNIDDFLVSRPGGVVRVTGNPGEAVMPLVAPDTSSGALQGLEYLDTVREQRTGYTRNSAGLDNNALTNKTMGGMAMQLSQSQLRLEMIARTIAETGARDVFRIVHALTLKHSTKAEKVRLKGKWAEINPREWSRRTDLSVSIGLGTGTPEQQLGKLMALGPLQQQAQMLGLAGPMEGYNYIKEAYKLSGYKSAERFVHAPQMEPEMDPQTQQPKMGPDGKPVMKPKMPPPQKDPAVQVAEINAQVKQGEMQVKAKSDAENMQMQAGIKQQEQQNAFTLQQQNDARDDERAQRDHEREMQQLAYQHQLDQARMVEEFKFKYYEAQLKAQASVQAAALKPQPEARPDA